MLFPYLRTLQYCDGTDQPARVIGEPEGLFATEFTGSLHCANRGRVIRGAQMQAAAVTSVGMLIHSISLLLLGALGDSAGRRVLLMLDFGGLLGASLLNALFLRFDRGEHRAAGVHGLARVASLPRSPA